MKLFIVLSLVVASALATSFPKIISIEETIRRVAEFEQSLTGSSKPNPLINTTFGEFNFGLLDMTVFLDHGKHIVPLIQKGANVDATADDGTRPLHLASAYAEPYNAARLFIENGADVNAKMGTIKWIPLHIAYLTGRPNTVNLLINNGADQNALDMYGRKPKDYENYPYQKQFINNIMKYREGMKLSFEEQYDKVIKELGI